MGSYVTPEIERTLERHELARLPNFPSPWSVFFMHRPNEGRMMSTLFIFTHENIILTGDLCPRPGDSNGCISAFGFGLDWFAGRLSERYLCEKFLREVWQADAAADWCEYQVKEKDGYDLSIEDVAKLKEIAQDLRMDPSSYCVNTFCSALAGCKGDFLYDGAPGYDYPRSDAGWLCALQQKFRVLYRDLKEVPVL